MTKSKVIGSTLIIAGTTIGAGMLALPLASAGIGFFSSLALMLMIWALMAFTALLMLELHQYADKSATLHTLANTILGKQGKWVASASVLFLLYALCAAYIAGGGAQFTQRINGLLSSDISSMVGTVIFTLVVAAIVTVGTHSVDKVNRVLFTIKLIMMVAVLTFLAPNVTQSFLLSMPIQQGLVVAAIPVIFTSFGFHSSIPSIVNYLDGNTSALRKVIIIGSAMPLIVYILWQVVTLGVISQNELLANTGLTALLSTLSDSVQHSNISHSIGLFADLALVTSFLGVSLGLFEFLGDSRKKQQGTANRIQAAVITFTPPLCFALFYPQGFITALGYAAIALAVLAVLLPVAMIHTVRKGKIQPVTVTGSSVYKVAGGKFSLAISSMAAILVISSQVLISFGVLPSLG
ncbi:tyrosine transporter TyrP [Vibrio sp. 10N.286.49.B3]|uniref:aromatic amino acid transport family protein n=1 Tax=Vibrio sp. 10N.286.49.B3 TaxID=1880855 RepID=UPI000C852C6B|nr:aromatic amino acid transport family protein [Vibrio sp. 10N.286.49.B3]PMH43792.1 tyrosine transporter TyrP [Vibrio sp. 10N.286.49.B3]